MCRPVAGLHPTSSVSRLLDFQSPAAGMLAPVVLVGGGCAVRLLVCQFEGLIGQRAARASLDNVLLLRREAGGCM